MTDYPYANNPARWRERAEEARTQAEQMNDETARLTMLKIAEGYDLMAQRAERRMEDDERLKKLLQSN